MSVKTIVIQLCIECVDEEKYEIIIEICRSVAKQLLAEALGNNPVSADISLWVSGEVGGDDVKA